MNEHELSSRLKNCLQTILEYEAELETLRVGSSLLQDFAQLKNFLARLETVTPGEADVERIERATAVLLKELEGPLGSSRQCRIPARQLQ